MLTNGKAISKVAIYARCSTDESRQDVELQLGELRRWCQAFGYAYEEFSEYCSGYRDEQPKLKELVKRIQHQEFDVLLTYSLDRLSRQAPSKTNRLLDELVEQHGCRLITRLENIDSENELTWHVVRPTLAYFSNLFSRNLSQRIRAGIQHQRERGEYRGGRPKKQVDADRLKALLLTRDGMGWRKLADRYNEGLKAEQRVSFSLLRRIAQQLQFSTKEPEKVQMAV